MSLLLDVLKTQLIFAGTTDECHPGGRNAVPPEVLVYHHTMSHWQNDASYLKYVREIIVPYKKDKIQKLGLSVNQKTLLKLDLH